MTIEKNITATEGTFDGKLSLEFVLAIAQDALTSYFSTLGIDNMSMKKNFNAIWVVAKNNATVFSRPKWNEKTLITCSLIKTGKFTCYCITDMNTLSGEKVFSVTSELCAVYTENLRFVNLDLLSMPCETLSIDKTQFAFSFPEEKGTEKDVNVSPLLIDFSNHLNNAKLLFPVVDSLLPEELEKIYDGVFEIKVHYKKQAMSGEKLIFSLIKQENGIYFSYRFSDGTVASSGCIQKVVR